MDKSIGFCRRRTRPMITIVELVFIPLVVMVHSSLPGQIDRRQSAAVVSVSEGIGYNDEPALVRADDGSIYVAWHSFQDNNYDIWLRRRAADGTWANAVRLTQAPSIDRHATLVARGDDLWLLYENALIEPFKVKAREGKRCQEPFISTPRLSALVTTSGTFSPKTVPDTFSASDPRRRGRIAGAAAGAIRGTGTAICRRLRDADHLHRAG